MGLWLYLIDAQRAVLGGALSAAAPGQFPDKRRQLMMEWATYCNMPKAAMRKIVPLRGRP